MDLNYYSIRELLDSAKKEGLPLSSLVLTQQAEQLELTEEEVYNKMRENYLVMLLLNRAATRIFAVQADLLAETPIK